ncbi:MAG: D-alanyl-D-alanine carboxypeptidase [Acidobacteriota bacterium]|nr:D-alanyl-D-alanine carboxypeptidase [Acidobacteriota bacterium]
MKRLPFLFEVLLLCLLALPVVADKFGKHKLVAKSEPATTKPTTAPQSARPRIAVKSSTTKKASPKPSTNKKTTSKKSSGKSVKKASLRREPVVSVPPNFNGSAMDEFAYRLQAEGRNLRLHGVYVERWDTGQPVAQLNENAVFNPASVIKLATTLAALDRLGPNHRFRTEFRTAGQINRQTGELVGDLILVSGRDPSFSIRDAQAVGDSLRAIGIRKVTGGLVVVGDFVCNENSRTDVSAGVFRRQSKLAFQGQTHFTPSLGGLQQATLLLAMESDSLLNIARYLNAHSSNAMADMLAQHVGGPAGVRSFLVVKLGLPYEATYISHGSGLDVNRLTPRDTVRVLRALVERLHSHRLRLESVMPIAGVDSSTLAGRFAEPEFIGSVLAKTGTLHDTDDGVAALAGVMNTRQCGALLFAVYDMAEGRRVLHLRRVQDDLLKRLMNECGGAAPLAVRSESDAAFRPQSRLIGQGR